jgi:hypothetical protein
LITCCPLAHIPRPYLYNPTLISLQLFKSTPISLQLNLWLLSHDLYLFELLTWSYSDSNSTWSRPQLGFQLNRIPYHWTLLGSDFAYSGLDSFLFELKVLIPLWTRTPSQFGLVFSIFFLSSLVLLTWITFTLSVYPISLDRLTRISPKQLIRSSSERLTRALPDCLNSYPALYVQTQPNYLTRSFSDQISAYPIVPGHRTRLPCPTG